MPHTTTDWTAERVRALPDDGKRYEVVDGELQVTPAPRLLHQRAVFELAKILDRHTGAHKFGDTLFSPSDIELDEHTLVQPDVFVVPRIGGRSLRDWSAIEGRLLLAVEVLSPSTARFDRQLKRRRYQQAGIPEYWIVDLDARLVERWRPEDERPEILAETLEWRPAAELEPLVIDLSALFAEILDA